MYVWLTEQTPHYDKEFCRIGPDVEDRGQILVMNRVFREEGLPRRFVMINHGHDGICVCWDTWARPVEGELPLVLVHLEPTRDWGLGQRYANFRACLEEVVREFAVRSSSKAMRRRAKEILAPYSRTRPKRPVSWKDRVEELRADWEQSGLGAQVKPDWKWMEDGTKLQVAYFVAGLLGRDRTYTAPEIERLVREQVQAKWLTDPQFAPDHIRMAMLEQGLIDRDDAGRAYWLTKSFFAPVDGEEMLNAVRRLMAEHPGELLNCPACGLPVGATSLLVHFAKHHSSEVWLELVKKFAR
jgi:hypothetical protein